MVTVLAALAMALGTAGTASAQATALTVTVTSTDAIAGALVNVTVSGKTDDLSPLTLFYEPDAGDCAPTQAEHVRRPNVHTFDILYPGAGEFSFASSFTPEQAASYRICAYLYYQRDNLTLEPRTLTTTTLPVAIKPGSDADGDLRPVPVDRCPGVPAATDTGCPVLTTPVISASKQKLGKGAFSVSITCNLPCDLVYTTSIGSIKFNDGSSSTRDAKAKKVTVRLTKASLKKVAKLLKRSSSVTATIKVAATSTYTASQDTPEVLTASKSFTITR